MLALLLDINKFVCLIPSKSYTFRQLKFMQRPNFYFKSLIFCERKISDGITVHFLNLFCMQDKYLYSKTCLLWFS